MRIISYLCTQNVLCSDTAILAALAYVHPQYSYWNIEATRFCLVSRIWKIQTMYTRRGTTVHVYTWACRLIVFIRGFPEPYSETLGYTGPLSLYPYFFRCAA